MHALLYGSGEKSFNLNHRKTENTSDETQTLESQALAYLKKNGILTVPELYDVLRTGNPSLTRSKIMDLVWHLVERGQVDVEDLPPPAKSLWEYLLFWERNISFYVPLAISLATVLVIYIVPSEFPWVISRWVLSSVFVLFLPGYVTIETVFPKSRELNGIERFALSVGLSLALAPLIGLLLNYTPWGFELTPIVISLSTFTLGVVMVGLGRRYRMRSDH
jgi:hypothetical protein